MTHRKVVASAAFVLTFGLAAPVFAKWSVLFVPMEATNVSVSIDGQHVMDWKSTEGQTIKDVPAKWAELEKLHVRAEASPTGQKARIKVFWDEKEHCDMKFDHSDDCTAAR
jgi:hypothetical protein